MDYRFWMILVVGFVVGRLSKLTIYIGTNETKYNKADFGILLDKK